MKDKKKKCSQEPETENEETAGAEEVTEEKVTEEKGPETEEPSSQEEQPEEEPKSSSAELDAEKDKFYRLYADFENYKKRTKAEKESIYSLAVCDTAAAFIPAIDNLERAIAATEDPAMKKGIEMVYSQMQKALTTMKIEAYGEKGDKFDPNIHEAILQSDEEGVEPDTITDVLQKGYKLGTKVIRHAMVKVAN